MSILPQLGDREVLGSFCTEGQRLYPFQHILGKKPTRARKKTGPQPQNRQKAGITAQKQEADGQKPLSVKLNTHLPVCSRGDAQSVQSDAVSWVFPLRPKFLIIITVCKNALQTASHAICGFVAFLYLVLLKIWLINQVVLLCCFPGEHQGLYTASSSQNTAELTINSDQNVSLNII